MANGLDRFPGHAYAPGMEPKFWDSIALVSPEAVGGLPSLPVLAVGILLLMLCASRLLAPRTKLRSGGAGVMPRGREGGVTSGSFRPDHAETLTRTIMDSNFARELRESRGFRRNPNPGESAD